MLNIISLLEANESVQNLVEMNDMELRLARDILKYLKEHNAPIIKPRLLEETDKAWTVQISQRISVSNFDVWFREAEKARLEKSDYRIRLHLATHDTVQQSELTVQLVMLFVMAAHLNVTISQFLII